MLEFARQRSNWVWNVTPIGCGNAGYTPEEIAPMFKGAPPNVILPPEFLSVLNKTQHNEGTKDTTGTEEIL